MNIFLILAVGVKRKMSTFLPFFHNLLSTGVIPLGRYTASIINNHTASSVEPINIDVLGYTNDAMFGIIESPNEDSRVRFTNLNRAIYLKYTNGNWSVFHTWSCP